MASVHHLNSSSFRTSSPHITSRFEKDELGQILALYSQNVAKGEWRDYAIDILEQSSIFSIFRHSHERPLFTVTKSLGHKSRYAEFSVHSGNKPLKKSRNLIEALSVLHEPSD
ncbi:DUF2794 domain-containing protein [Kiloniella sp. b19]|uniref:DUF2794 domain-containing protein n=1 Tax=Kiloniella sp. GXU_MW_B19 TaxID=3141326 RepID=UPI0031D7D346